MAMGEPTIAEFSRMMQISTPNAAYKIGSLVRKGYVEKILFGMELDKKKIKYDGNYSITSGKENVCTIVQSGPIQDGNKPFSGMEGLTGIDVSGLDTSNVTDMSVYFSRTSLPNFGLFYKDLKYWDTRKVTTFEAMFLGCELATSIQGINEGQ